MESKAGEAAGYPDSSFQAAGAEIVQREVAFASDVIVKVCKPTREETNLIRSGALLIAMLEPHASAEILAELNQRSISAIALELVPRTSRAQSMDVLSSQANIAGYRSSRPPAVMDVSFR